MAAAMARRQQGPQQEGRAADLGAGAVPRVLRNAGQKRADRRAQLNIEASNLWNFFQAKTIRQTSLRIVAAEQIEARPCPARPTGAEGRDRQSRSTTWKKTAARYRSEPEAAGGKGEGTVELIAPRHEERAPARRHRAQYHHYEFASAAFQIGIVLASATVITGMVALAWLAGGLGVVGLAFTAIGAVRAARCCILHLSSDRRTSAVDAAAGACMRRRMRQSSRNARAGSLAARTCGATA